MGAEKYCKIATILAQCFPLESGDEQINVNAYLQMRLKHEIAEIPEVNSSLILICTVSFSPYRNRELSIYSYDF